MAGRARRYAGRARAYGGGLFKRLASRRTLTVAAVGAATEFVPAPFQPAATAIGGAMAGSETLVDVGAFAMGKQAVRMLSGVTGALPGQVPAGNGGFL